MYNNDGINRRYSEGYKLKVLAELTTGKYNKTELSKIYGINRTTLNSWIWRILEYYFTVFGQFSNIKKLPSGFKTIEEQMICKSLVSWVHDGSHDISDEINISDNDDAVLRFKDVFRAIFDSNGQLGHYNQMMGIEVVENKKTNQ